MERVRELVALQRRFARSVAPNLAGRSRVTHERDGTIYIQADTAAVAAKLRNLTARIFADLREDWPNLTGIHVGTQPTPRYLSRPRETRELSEEGRIRLTELAETLPDGPLKRSLARWSLR